MVSGGLTAINIKGTSGSSLRDKWRSGNQRLSRLCDSWFPEHALFWMGPQSPSGLSRLELRRASGDEIVELLKFMRADG